MPDRSQLPSLGLRDGRGVLRSRRRCAARRDGRRGGGDRRRRLRATAICAPTGCWTRRARAAPTPFIRATASCRRTRRIRRGRRGCGPDLDRADAARAIARHGRQGARARARAGRRLPVLPGSPRFRRRQLDGARGSGRARSAFRCWSRQSAGGGGIGMRRVDAPDQLAAAVSGDAGDGAQARSATARSTWSATSTGRATSRSRCSASATARRSTCTSATARSSGASRR